MNTSTRLSRLFFCVLAALLALMAAPSALGTVGAMPLAALTPSGVPPTPTSTALPTATSTALPTATSTALPTATSTALPTSTPLAPSVDEADPALTKAVAPSEARIGDIVLFTITVTNRGGGPANEVVVVDPVPDYLDVIEGTSTSGAVTNEGRTVIVTIGRLGPGEEVIIRIRTRVNERWQLPGGVNSATLTTSSRGDVVSNNSGVVTLSVHPSGPGAPTAGTPTATVAPTAIPSPTRIAPTATPRRGAGGAAPRQSPNDPNQPVQQRLPSTGAGDDDLLLLPPALMLVGLLMMMVSLFFWRCRRFL